MQRLTGQQAPANNLGAYSQLTDNTELSRFRVGQVPFERLYHTAFPMSTVSHGGSHPLGLGGPPAIRAPPAPPCARCRDGA